MRVFANSDEYVIGWFMVIILYVIVRPHWQHSREDTDLPATIYLPLVQTRLPLCLLGVPSSALYIDTVSMHAQNGKYC